MLTVYLPALFYLRHSVYTLWAVSFIAAVFLLSGCTTVPPTIHHRRDPSIPHSRPLHPNITSPAVEKFIYSTATQLRQFGQNDLAALFTNTFARTLDTGVAFMDDTDAAISTGDIPAMWIRDSVNQVSHLTSFIQQDALIHKLLCGVLTRLSRCILIDPFANAFNFDLTAMSAEHGDDRTTMLPGVFERKFELDSWASYLKLVNDIGSVCPSSKDLVDSAVSLILDKARKFQQLDTSEYSFTRNTDKATEMLQDGRIMPAAVTGMIPSAFRPSDDVCELPFHIPSNAFFSVELERFSSNFDDTRPEVKSAALILSTEIKDGIEKHGKVVRGNSMVFAYEVDGRGSVVLMDDANLPSLLSLPLLGYVSRDDPVYQTTRSSVLSAKTNAWYFEGTVSGVGSPHTGRDRVWPLGLMTEFLTEADRENRLKVLRSLIDTGRLSGLFFESVSKSDIEDFTRGDFGWANSFFSFVVADFLMDIQ